MWSLGEELEEEVTNPSKRGRSAQGCVQEQVSIAHPCPHHIYPPEPGPTSAAECPWLRALLPPVPAPALRLSALGPQNPLGFPILAPAPLCPGVPPPPSQAPSVLLPLPPTEAQGREEASPQVWKGSRRPGTSRPEEGDEGGCTPSGSHAQCTQFGLAWDTRH